MIIGTIMAVFMLVVARHYTSTNSQMNITVDAQLKWYCERYLL